MTTLMPRGYGAFPSYQFSPPNQFHNRHFNGGYPRQGIPFAPHYPTKPFYQPPFKYVDQSVVPYANQYREPSLDTQLIMWFNELDAQYRQERYLRQLQKMQKKYWKQQANNLPPPLYYSPGTVYQYEKETEYIPYPVYVGPNARSYGTPGSNMALGRGGGMNLPPKVRVIFIPTGQSFSQQPHTGSLAMPPFLYNRISQPLCSFPLPPPLPQLGSLPLTPAVQQMVVQRYSNPVAVLPFTPNWQPPQMMVPGYPPVPPPPQLYIPPAPQIYIPPLPPAPISAPQAFIPPPPPPVVPPYNANVNVSSPQYSYNGYPSICRACPPAPPPLNIAVTGHCWVQHCTACHHVPTPVSNPNIRPTGGRITPLLRQPTVPQYIPEQARQQYLYANAPVMMRPWLRKTPPIPPGAVVISDEIIDKNTPNSQYKHSQRQHRQYERGSRHKYRSTTVAPKANPATNSTTIKNNRSISPRRISNNDVHSNQQQESAKVKDSVVVSSSSTSSSDLSAEYDKLTLHPPGTEQQTIPQQLTREARNVNLQYKYKPEELPTVYLINRYLKSSSETSTSVSSNPSSPMIKQFSPISSSSSSSLSSTRLHSIKNELISKGEDEKPPRPPSRSKKPKEKLIVIREFTASSPSTLSTISSNMEFSVLNKDEDSISTTSTLKTDHSEDDDIPQRNLF